MATEKNQDGQEDPSVAIAPVTSVIASIETNSIISILNAPFFQYKKIGKGGNPCRLQIQIG